MKSKLSLQRSATLKLIKILLQINLRWIYKQQSVFLFKLSKLCQENLKTRSVMLQGNYAC